MVVISDSESDKCGFPKLVLEWIFKDSKNDLTAGLGNIKYLDNYMR